MQYDLHSRLWPSTDSSRYFSKLQLSHRQQIGGTCVSTALSLLTHDDPLTAASHINSQSPQSWSDYLQAFNFQLAYCNTDFRRLKYYVPELLALNDVFAVSTYSSSDLEVIGSEPDDDGWVTGSHFVMICGRLVYDTRFREPMRLDTYCDLNRYIKRIFRVVPANHSRRI